MKTIHVCQRFAKSAWGGRETVVLQTCRNLIGRGCETQVFCPAMLASREEEVIERTPVRRFRYRYPCLRLPEHRRVEYDETNGDPVSVPMLRALRREPGVEILHAHAGGRVGGAVRRAAMLRRVPYVVTVHPGSDPGFDELSDSPGGAPARVMDAWFGAGKVLRDANAILCIGREDLRRARERNPRAPVLPFPNGVDPQRFERGRGVLFRRRHGIPEDARVVLSVGRIAPHKNQDFAVRLMPELLSRDPRIHLLLLGRVADANYESQLTGLARQFDIVRSVTIVRGVDASSEELVDAYHAADVFFLPALREPFGIVVLEAWAAGLPVCAARAGGLPALIRHDMDGLLYPPDDAKAALECLRVLLDGGGRARALTASGQRLAREQYSWDKVAGRLLEIYEDVLRERRSRR